MAPVLNDPNWALFCVAGAVVTLIVLIAWLKIQPLIAFVVVSIGAALALHMPVDGIMKSVEKGVGDMTGSLAILLALGAMFGKLIADSGAAQRIAQSLIGLFGANRMSIALTLTGFIVGIPLFYNVGFVLLVPLIFSLSASPANLWCGWPFR